MKHVFKVIFGELKAVEGIHWISDSQKEKESVVDYLHKPLEIV